MHCKNKSQDQPFYEVSFSSEAIVVGVFFMIMLCSHPNCRIKNPEERYLVCKYCDHVMCHRYAGISRRVFDIICENTKGLFRLCGECNQNKIKLLSVLSRTRDDMSIKYVPEKTTTSTSTLRLHQCRSNRQLFRIRWIVQILYARCVSYRKLFLLWKLPHHLTVNQPNARRRWCPALFGPAWVM